MLIDNELNLVNAIETCLLEGSLQYYKKIGITDKLMQDHFLSLCKILQKKQYKKASDASLFLCLLDSTSYDYWSLLGISEMLLKHYEKALQAFGVCSILEVDNPIPHVNATECYIALKNWPLAKESLKVATVEVKGKEEFIVVKERIKELSLVLKHSSVGDYKSFSKVNAKKKKLKQRMSIDQFIQSLGDVKKPSPIEFCTDLDNIPSFIYSHFEVDRVKQGYAALKTMRKNYAIRSC